MIVKLEWTHINAQQDIEQLSWSALADTNNINYKQHDLTDN